MCTRVRVTRPLAAVCLAASLAVPLGAAIIVPGADGSSGPLNITANTTIDLGLATTGPWTDAAGPNGVYDPVQWAVVFKYSSVNIGSGATLKFRNHPSRAPVVWLVNGDVTVAGTVSLDSISVAPLPGTSVNQEAGPGGWRGGENYVSTSVATGPGMGPGGGNTSKVGWSDGSTGSHATPGEPVGVGVPGAVYGSPMIVPLLGGSGGSGYGDRYGGAGGGAILIAATGQVTVSGRISANGGSGNQGTNPGGAGGAVRVVADILSGTGALTATGAGTAGDGRIRLEANSGGVDLKPTPVTAIEAPTDPALIFPPASAPSVRVLSVGSASVPGDPRASFGPAPADVRLYNSVPEVVVIETRNLEPSQVKVTLRVAPVGSKAQLITATLSGGDKSLATWTATVTPPQGFCAMQVRVDPL